MASQSKLAMGRKADMFTWTKWAVAQGCESRVTNPTRESERGRVRFICLSLGCAAVGKVGRRILVLCCRDAACSAPAFLEG